MKAIIGYKDLAQTVQLAVVCDSAITRARDPFFVPDDRTWKILPLYGIIIDRLGKGIQQKFAYKYYHQCFRGAHPFAAENPDLFVSRWERDGALIMGMPTDIVTLDQEIKTTFDTFIETISKFCTLKTGDMLLFGNEKEAFHIENCSHDYFIDPNCGLPGMKVKIR